MTRAVEDTETGEDDDRIAPKLNTGPMRKEKVPGAGKLRGPKPPAQLQTSYQPMEDPMAFLSHDGNANTSTDESASVPTPTSLCPQCGQVTARDRLYILERIYEAHHACPNGHDWVVRWFAPSEVAG